MNNAGIKGIRNHEADNVATIFGEAITGSDVDVIDSKGNRQLIKVLDEIPYGHKVAMCAIKRDEQITKYGEEIGIATRDIKVGEHVHIHNIDSIRGRGDWAQEERSV